MARTRFLTLPILCALAAPAWACLWYYGKNVNGESVKFDGFHGHPDRFMEYLTRHPEHDDALRADTSTEPPAAADFKVRSDYAATLVHQGKAAKAIPILEEIESAHPNEYVIAVNLGTAYELTGDNEKALRWIREGLRRNPNSHSGTEWLHVRILEAKIAAAKDPGWIKTHSVLGLDFGSGDTAVLPSRFPAGQSAESVRQALVYQLHERLAFVSPPDALVGGMIADLGDLEGLQETADHAVALYTLALPFQPVHADLIQRRKAHALQFAGQIVSEHERTEHATLGLLGLAGFLIVGAVILFVGQRLRTSGSGSRRQTLPDLGQRRPGVDR